MDVSRTLLRSSFPNFNVTFLSSDCICSCAIARLVNRQYVEIDYSQCSVFMQCRWGKSMKFNINIMTENQVYIYSEQMKVDSSKRVCSLIRQTHMTVHSPGLVQTLIRQTHMTVHSPGLVQTLRRQTHMSVHSP